MALIRPAAVALLLTFVVGFLGLQSVAFTDYEHEAEPAAVALAAGDLGRFVDLAPTYGGSLVLRAPFALAAGAVGRGGDLFLYRALALPALLLIAGLAFGLWRHARAAGAPGAWWVLVLAAANPLTLRALDYGHPEEVVGAVLCVAALLAALRDRALAAGVLAGLAMANKPWAVVALLPVVLTLDRGRLRCLLAAGGITAAVMAPLLLLGSAGTSLTAVATARTTIFTPWQVFWFFGEHSGPVYSWAAERSGYRTAAAWVQPLSHPAVVLAGVGLSCAWFPRRSKDTALALLALVLLTRCALDTWTTSYYALPFVLALLAHEVVARERAPWGTGLTVLVLWVVFELLPSADAEGAAFLLVGGTLWASLALAAFAPARAARVTARVTGALATVLPSLVPRTRGRHQAPAPASARA